MSGPNGEMNGTDVLLYIKHGASTFVIGSQRGVTFKEANAPIDFSSKLSRAGRFDYGRYTATANLQNLYVPTASGLATIRTFTRNGTKLGIARFESGAQLEYADCVITGLGYDGPDQGPVVVSLDLQVDGTWTAAS